MDSQKISAFSRILTSLSRIPGLSFLRSFARATGRAQREVASAARTKQDIDHVRGKKD